MEHKTNRLRRLFILVGLMCGLAFGCLSAYGKTVAIDQSFALREGQEAWLAGTSLGLRVSKVADSRCPAYAKCVWAGNGAVKLDVNMRGQREATLTVNTNNTPQFPGEQVYAGYTISLVALNPYPGTKQRRSAANKVATLKISRAAGPRQVRLGEPFSLKLSEEVLVAGTDLQLKFTEVEDSRCPKNVTCVWAGNGVVKLSASLQGKNPQIVTLNTVNTQQLPGEQNYVRYKLKVQKLAPYPGDGQAGDKVATLTVWKIRW